LERLLLRGGQEIDPSGQDRVDGVGNGEAGRELGEQPVAVRPLQKATVDEGREELLDEERVPLRVRDHDLLETTR
jgi:hypothetical protein